MTVPILSERGSITTWHREHMSARTAGFAVTIPVTVFLVVLGTICAALLHRPAVAVVGAVQAVAVANRGSGAGAVGANATMAAP